MYYFNHLKLGPQCALWVLVWVHSVHSQCALWIFVWVHSVHYGLFYGSTVCIRDRGFFLKTGSTILFSQNRHIVYYFHPTESFIAFSQKMHRVFYSMRVYYCFYYFGTQSPLFHESQLFDSLEYYFLVPRDSFSK